MSYFQNVLESEFRGNWVLGDRQYVIEFIAPANLNKSNYQQAWNSEPYNMSVNNILTLNYAWDTSFLNYSSLNINVAGAIPGATLASEVVTALNSNAIFAEMFTASIYPLVQPATTVNSLIITPKSGRVKQTIRLWISNSGAQLPLGFNNKASVVQLPLYMARHTIANRFAFTDSQACLVQLSHPITSITVANPTVVTCPNHGLSSGNIVYIGGSNSSPSVDGSYTATVVDGNTFTIPVNVTTAGDRGAALSATENTVVTNAGYVIANVQTDWQLLCGRSGIFNFQNITVDGSNRITQIIEYPAGSVVGAFAKKTQYVYSGGNTSPSRITEIPYTLTANDLITPP